MSGTMDDIITRVQQFWLGREPRERLVLGLGGVAVAVLLAYQLVWSPVAGWNAEQQVRLQQDMKLAAYVAHAKVVLIRQRAQGAASPQSSNTSAMQTAYEAARTQGIDARIDRREPTSDDGVRLIWSDVPFSALAQWMASMNQAGLQVTEADLGPAQSKGTAKGTAKGMTSGNGNVPGHVDAKIVLKAPTS